MIKDFEACYVFSPTKARGNNGVLLQEMLRIGSIRELLVEMTISMHN